MPRHATAEGRGVSRFPAWAAIIVLGWMALVGVNEWIRPPGASGPAAGEAITCNFRRVTGVPCPTCGTTRASMALIHGRVGDAIAFNPLFVGGSMLAAAWIAARWVMGRRIAPDLSRRARIACWIALAAAFIANWAYLIAYDRL